MKFILYTTLAMISYAIGEIFSKMYANTQDVRFAVIGFLGGMGTVILWIPSLNAKNMLALTTTLWTLLYLLIGVGVGLVLFHEKLSWLHSIAVGLAFISLILLCMDV